MLIKPRTALKEFTVPQTYEDELKHLEAVAQAFSIGNLSEAKEALKKKWGISE